MATPLHIHQGGTLNCYCGKPLPVWPGENAAAIGWEEAHRATCPGCRTAFFDVARDHC